VTRVAFGSIDFGVDAGLAEGDDEPGMTVVRVQIALESRLANLPAPIDGVTTSVDGDSAARHVQHARKLGFGAKLCIHPRQVAAVHAAFLPSAAEQAWAARVLAAFEASAGAAVALDGKMIDQPVVEPASPLARLPVGQIASMKPAPTCPVYRKKGEASPHLKPEDGYPNERGPLGLVDKVGNAGDRIVCDLGSHERVYMEVAGRFNPEDGTALRMLAVTESDAPVC
jgi:hypothetical protein